MAFKRLHPITTIIFFFSILFLTMLTSNPLLLAISFVCSFFTNLLFQKKKSFWLGFFILLFMLAIITITNPLFNQSGETILFYVGRFPFTKESLFNGLTIGIMIAAIIYWFMAFNEIMTTEKMYYLFGKTAPTITLVLTMGFRFIPNMIMQAKKVEEAQLGLGIYMKSTFITKVRFRLRMVSSLITWSLEHAIDTADAMQSRGYGLKNKTNFSVFKFRIDDCIYLMLILLFFFLIATGEFLNIYSFKFYPNLGVITFGTYEVIGYFSILFLGIIPLIIEGMEAIKWRYWKLKI